MIKLSANETKWGSLLARTHVFILYISISIFDFGPEKLPGLSRNVLLNTRQSKMQISCALGRVLCSQYSQFRGVLGTRMNPNTKRKIGT